MITRLTYFKRLSNDLQIWCAEYDENFKLTISTSNEGEEPTEKQYDNLQTLEEDVAQQIKQVEQKGFKLAAKQTFVDPEHPTVDELESQILLRYKLMGFTDTVLLANARKEAMKILKNESGEREDYDLDTMQFVVDLNNHDSLKALLEWQIENFDDLVKGVRETMGISYGHIDPEEGFVSHEDDDHASYNSEGLFYAAAARHEDLHPLIVEFISKLIEANGEHPIFRDEETPYGAWAAYELAMADKKFLSLHTEYVNSLEDNAQYYYDRFNGNYAMHIPALLLKYGFDKNDDTLIEFIAAQTVHRDHQHFEEEVSAMMELGLEEALEDEEFKEKLFAAMIRRAQYLSDYYQSSSVTKWVARDLASSFDIMGIEASQESILKVLGRLDDGGEMPTLAEFEEGIEDDDDDNDDDDEDDDDEDDDEEDDDEEDEDDDDDEDERPKNKKSKSGKKITKKDYRDAVKVLASLDEQKIKDLISTGIPLNEYEFNGYPALYCFQFIVYGSGEKTDAAYCQKVDNLFMMLINAGAEADFADLNAAGTALAYNCTQTMEYFRSKGFDINKTTDRHGQTLLDGNIYVPEMVEILLDSGADPTLKPTVLHDALRYLPLKLVRRLTEEFKVPLNNIDQEGRTPVEAIVHLCEHYVEPNIEGYRKDSEDPKRKNKTNGAGDTPADQLAEALRQLENRDYIVEFCKDMKPLYCVAENAEEQAELNKKLIEACKASELQPVTMRRLLGVKADPNARDENGMTPLHHVARQHYPHLISEGLDILREAGAQPGLVDNFGRTPVFYFCTGYHGDVDALRDLVNFGIDPAHKDKEGFNALGYMIGQTDPKDKYNNESTIKSMLAVGVPPVDIDPDGGNLYHHLSMFDGFEVEEIVETLKEKGIDINARNKKGEAPLHVAAKDPNKRDFCDSYIERLLEAGADVNAQDTDGNTAIHLSTYPADDYEYLLKASPDLNLKNKDGKSALDIIKERGMYSDKYEEIKELVDSLI